MRILIKTPVDQEAAMHHLNHSIKKNEETVNMDSSLSCDNCHSAEDENCLRDDEDCEYYGYNDDNDDNDDYDDDDRKHQSGKENSNHLSSFELFQPNSVEGIESDNKDDYIYF